MEKDSRLGWWEYVSVVVALYVIALLSLLQKAFRKDPGLFFSYRPCCGLVLLSFCSTCALGCSSSSHQQRRCESPRGEQQREKREVLSLPVSAAVSVPFLPSPFLSRFLLSGCRGVFLLAPLWLEVPTYAQRQRDNKRGPCISRKTRQRESNTSWCDMFSRREDLAAALLCTPARAARKHHPLL